ncbi:TPA: hypothetical protein U1D20_001209 [Streptococcus suis]|nr:hypothetical protein [Streptococcus suis]
MGKLSPKPESRKYSLEELDTYLRIAFSGPNPKVTIDINSYDIPLELLLDELKSAGYKTSLVGTSLEIK